MTRMAVHEEDSIWFRIPFTAYWVGKVGPGNLLCLWIKEWDPERSMYYWDRV